MAIEILIRLYDGTGGRNAGDIVSVKQVPHAGWGNGEGLPNYAIVRVTNLDLADFAPYHQRHYRVDVGGTIYGARSRRKVDLPGLPTNIRNALFNNGFYEFRLGANLISRLEENTLTVKEQ